MKRARKPAVPEPANVEASSSDSDLPDDPIPNVVGDAVDDEGDEGDESASEDGSSSVAPLPKVIHTYVAFHLCPPF
jgi:hypothetical protein